ncbi:hypothetical protein BGZ91_002075, partial [Linnemannia elongata]
TSVMFSPDGRQLVSGSFDGTIRFWDPETGEPGCVLRSSLEPVHSLAYSPDGKWIASGHDSGPLQLWDAVSNEPSSVLQGHTSSVLGVAFSPNGQWIASASYDKTVTVWDTSTGAVILILSGQNAPVQDVAFSPNGLQLASGGHDKKVRLWDLNSSWSASGLQGHRVNSLLKAAYFPDGLSILAASNRSVQQWDSKTGASLPMTFQFPEAFSGRDIEFSPDGNQIAAAYRDGVQVWDRRTRTAGSVFKIEHYRLTRVVYSPCGRWVAVWLWDLHDITAKDHHVLIEFKIVDRFERRSVTFSNAGHQLAIGLADGSVRVFDPQSGDHLSSLQLMPGAMGALVYSPVHQQVAIGGDDNSIYLWDGQSEDTSIKLDGHSAIVQSIVYSPCGQWIASGSKDKTVRLWRRRQEGESECWQCAGVVRAFIGTVLDVAWNPTTRMEFATRCDDNSVQVWQVSTNNKSVVVRMLWGYNIGNLCAEDLISKDAIDLSPMNQKLLVQRGAVDSSLVPEGEVSDA